MSLLSQCTLLLACESQRLTNKMKKILLLAFLLSLCLAQGPTTTRMLEGLKNVDVSDWLASTPELIPNIQ